jgi:hypothetical protein
VRGELEKKKAARLSTGCLRTRAGFFRGAVGSQDNRHPAGVSELRPCGFWMGVYSMRQEDITSFAVGLSEEKLGVSDVSTQEVPPKLLLA